MLILHHIFGFKIRDCTMIASDSTKPTLAILPLKKNDLCHNFPMLRVFWKCNYSWNPFVVSEFTPKVAILIKSYKTQFMATH